MNKFKQLINGHSHSMYSLDGAATIDDIVIRNKELGATHVAVTEHGVMNSAIELYEKARKHGLKPICGIELYIEPPFLEEMRPIIASELAAKGKKLDGADGIERIDKQLKSEYAHLTVHFKDEWAYNYFTKLTPKMESRALIKFGERKPIATIDEIAGAAGHITICSSCLIGIVNKFYLPRRNSKVSRPDLAEKAYNLIREIAGKDNFFVEVFPHEVTHDWKKPVKDKATGKTTPGGFIPNECSPFAPDGDLQKTTNQFVINLAKKNNDPIIVSLDSHFATPEQKVVQDARLGNGQDSWKFHNSYHICPSHEAFESLKRQLDISERDFEEWIDNSYKFANQFNDYKMTTNKERWVLQPLPDNYQDKLIELINNNGRMDWSNNDMCERLRYEIDVLANNGKINLLSYFFTVEDISSFCRENDILINVRGSAGGSLLLFLLGVSAVNPMKHDLSFERFLTAGRIKANTLPDVDMDVAEQGLVFEYLQKKYGDAFCRISIDSQLKLKSSIRDTERAVIGKVRPETEKLCVMLPKLPQGISDYDFTFGYTDDHDVFQPGLVEIYAPIRRYKEANPEIWETVTEMLGIVRQKSQHACGVVIADGPVQNYIPITQIGDAVVTGFSPKQLETAGLIKFDILGVNTLRDIQNARKLIKEQQGVEIDPFNLPYSKEAFEALGRGDTVTVFQLDSETAKPLLRGIKPKNIEDISATTSLGRPGTLDAPSGEFEGGRQLTLAEIYIARAQGRPIRYIHPELEPIMKETLGVQLYQEQTLRIFRDIANYTYEQAETVRRGIGKKDKVVLESCMGDLRAACTAKGWTKDQVDLLIEQIMASSNYSFNKSHAISYAYMAYACIYMRLHYPIEWWTAILTNAKKEDLQYYWPHAVQWIKMPEINNSDSEFYIKTIGKDRYIQAPITLLDGVGPATTAEIALKKPFANFEDFVNRVNRTVINKGIVFKFILSGLVDNLFPEGITDMEKLKTYLSLKKRLSGGKEEAIPEDLMNLSPLKQLQHKRSIFTVYKLDWTPAAAPYLEAKGLIQRDNYVYVYLDPNKKDLHGRVLLDSEGIKRKLDTRDYNEDIFAMVGYIAEAEEVTYTKKSFDAAIGKEVMTPTSMMKFLIESGDVTIEAIKWPDWGKSTHGIEKDMNGKIALFLIQRKIHSERGLQLTVKKVLDISNIDK